MTPVYEVNTKHTKQTLEDFVKFRNRIRSPRVTFNLVTFAVCLAILGHLLGGGIGTYILIVLAVVILIFAMLRRKIGVSKLAKVDVNYQKQSTIQLIFGESEFFIKNVDAGQDDRIRYGEISYIYADNHYYYLSVNNENLQLIPKTDFILGDSTAFYDFISDKTGKQILPVYLPWKVRIRMMIEYRDKMADEREKRKAESKGKK